MVHHGVRIAISEWRAHRALFAPFSPWPDPHAREFGFVTPGAAVTVGVVEGVGAEPCAPLKMGRSPRVLKLLCSPMFRGFDQVSLPDIQEMEAEGECERCRFSTELFECQGVLLCNHCLSTSLPSLLGDSEEDY